MFQHQGSHLIGIMVILAPDPRGEDQEGAGGQLFPVAGSEAASHGRVGRVAAPSPHPPSPTDQQPSGRLLEDNARIAFQMSGSHLFFKVNFFQLKNLINDFN